MNRQNNEMNVYIDKRRSALLKLVEFLALKYNLKFLGYQEG